MTDVICLVNVESDRATFTWGDGTASFEPYELEGMDFLDGKELAQIVREKLSDLVKDYLSDTENVPQASYELAQAGYEFYQQIFSPGADHAPRARQVRDWLESLRRKRNADGSRIMNTLEIVVESPWSMPWNVVYDKQPNKEAFLSDGDNLRHWRPFWGIRYNLTGGRKVNPLRRLPLLENPDVLLVVDPSIRDGLPPEQQQELADFVKLHDLKMVTNKDELVAAAKTERLELVYWLSHATPSGLVLGDEEITPRLLRRILRRGDSSDGSQLGGLAFLNACQTAESSEAGSFFDALHSLGFSGMVGTEHQTVDTFANPLGLAFLEDFLIKGEPIGKVMRGLRAHVPLGLLYGTYCPPDIRVHHRNTTGDSASSIFNFEDSVKVIDMVPTEGNMLGATEVVREPPPPLPAEPYRSLATFSRQDRALFAGRDDDIERFASMLDDAATRILVLHGESGVGKSSFLHAGIIPYLEEECLGYRFLRDLDEGPGGSQKSVLFIRATNELYGQLAQALCDFCARSYEYATPLGEEVAADLPGVLKRFVGDTVNQATVRAVLRADIGLLGQILSAIGDQLPFAPVLVIDQCEEVFTLARSPEDLQRGQRALDMLRWTVDAAGDFKIILSLRTEYYGRLVDRLRRGLHDTNSIREYLLTDFGEKGLVEAIRRPTTHEPIAHAAEIPFEKYGFSYADSVAEEIAHRVVRFTTQRHDSVLPLVQVICAQLYGLVRGREDPTITHDDLTTLGGIEGGMHSHVNSLLGELLDGHARDIKPLQTLFTQLYLRQPDGTLTTALLAEDEVRNRWTGGMPIDELLPAAEAMRLLKVNSLRIGFEEERRYVSLGHDALAKIAADWDEELSRGARFRKMAAILTGVSSVAVVMAILAGLAWMKKNEAEAHFRKAREAVDTYFTNVAEDQLLRAPGMRGLRSTLLNKAKDDYEDFARDYGNDPNVHDEVAAALFNVGRIKEAAGNRKQATEDFEKAREIQEKRAPNASSDILTDEQQRRLHALGKTYMEIGNVRDKEGKSNVALRWYEMAADIRETLSTAAPQNQEYRLRLADTLMNIGLINQDQHDFQEARNMMAHAQDLRSKCDQIAAVRRDLGRGYYNLMRLNTMEFQYRDQAISDEAYRKAQSETEDDAEIEKKADEYYAVEYEKDGLDSLLEQKIHHGELARDTLMSLLNTEGDIIDFDAQLLLAQCYRALGGEAVLNENPAGAQASFEEARKLIEPLVFVNPGVPDYEEELANFYMDFAYNYQHLSIQKPPETQRFFYTRALEILEKLQESNPEKYAEQLKAINDELKSLSGSANRPAQEVAEPNATKPE